LHLIAYNKGVAGNLGAGAVQQIAGKLEKAITLKADSPELTPLLEQFGATLADFTARLGAALPPSEPAPAARSAPVDHGQFRRIVNEMMSFLSDSNPTARECLEDNRVVFQALLQGGLSFGSIKQWVVSTSPRRRRY